MKVFLKNNIYVFMWLGFAVFMELFSITFTDCKPYLSSPLYFLLILFSFCLILFLVPNRIAKIVIVSLLMIGQTALCVGFIYLYESNGTFFDFSMINMRDDAFGTIEDLSLNWVHFGISLGVLVLFVGVMIGLEVYFRKHHAQKFKEKKQFKISVGVVTALALVCLTIIPFC